MSRVVRVVLIAVAAVVVLVVAALVAVPYLVDTPRVQALIASTATQTLGRPVKFASLSVSVLPLPAVVLGNLEVAEDPAFGKGPFLKLREMRVRLKLWPLLFLRVELGDFLLEKPAISLVQAADGRWNVATLGGHAPESGSPPSRPRGGGGGGAAGGAALLGSRVKIEDGVVTYEARGPGAPARYHVEDLDLTVTGSPTGLAFRGNARVEPGALAVRIAEGLVGVNGARGLMEAPVRGQVSLDGKSLGALAAVAMGPEPALAGGLTGRLTLDGTVGKPRATGDVELGDFAVSQTVAQCPEPKRRTLALGTVKSKVAWEDPRFAARPLTTSLGGGSITANVTATLDRGVRVELGDIGIKGVPAEKVLVDFLCQGYAVSGPLDLTGSASARTSDLWNTLDGKGQLRVGPGKIVGSQALALLENVVRVGGAVSALLGENLPRGLRTSGLEYDSITGTFTITNGVLSTRDLKLASRTLTASAAGTYGLANGAVNMDIGLSSGQTQLQAKVTGSADRPSIRVNPTATLRDIDPAKVEKGLQDLLKRFR
ncbi:MAG TPA: AsmA-like C-terminal region-containing protein [Methylomirabilota bacterium]|nr:AsmA-like C-terminal region-containing protein [Methylomirabilota bacterium]